MSNTVMDELHALLDEALDPEAMLRRMNARTLRSVIESAMSAKDETGEGQVVFLHINKDGELID